MLSGPFLIPNFGSPRESEYTEIEQEEMKRIFYDEIWKEAIEQFDREFIAAVDAVLAEGKDK